MNTPDRILTGSISALLRKTPLVLAAVLTLTAPAAFADTISSSADVRVLSGDPDVNHPETLSLYNDGGGNVQRTFLQFGGLSSYSGMSVTTDATLTMTAGIYGDYLTGVSLGTANSAWTQAGITWNNQPGLTAMAGATNPGGTFGSGPVTWTIPWYMLEKLATTGSGYNNGLGITSGVGSTQHFQSTGSGGPAPTLTFSAATGASGVWTGGNGNWTGTANWAGSTVAEAIDQTAIINGGTAVNITMDANRSVGALSFSGANHTIGSGSGKLALNVTSGAPTITVQTGRIATFGATLVGIDGLTKTGNGTLLLTDANTFSGAVVVGGGTLQAGNNQALGALNNAVTVSSGATLDLGNAELFNYTQPITISGSGVGGVGAIYKSTPGNGALLQLRGITLASDASIGGVATSRMDIGRGDWTGPGPGAPVHIDGQGHTLSVVGGTFLGILAEAVNLAGVRIGTGSSVSPHNDASFGSATVTLDGGTLTPWNTHTFANNLVVTGNGGFIDNQSFDQTYTGTVQVNGAAQINTIAGGNITLAGNVSGGGAITKIGGYSLFLSGDNSGFTGTFTASQSNTFFLTDTAGSANADWVVNNSNLLGSQPGSHTYQLGSLAGSGGVIGNNLGNPDTGALTFVIGGKNTSANYSGVIIDTVYQAGTTAIRKVGTGTQTFSGANSYTGGTTINAGILRAGSDSALGAAGGSIAVTSGGSLDINGRQLDGYTQSISIAGAGAVPTLGALGNTGGNNLSAIRGITLTADASIGGDGGRWDIGRLDFDGDPNSTVNHIIGGGFVLTKVGSNYLGLLTGAANLAGFVINGGTVAPHENTSFGAGPVTLNSGIIQPYAGLNVANALTLNGGTIQTDGFNDNYNGAITVNAAATVNPTNGVITFNGNVSGSGDLSKTGGNVFVLAGNNTQTGTLTVNGGNVLFSSATGNATRGNVVMANGGSFLLMNAPNQFGANAGLSFNSAGHSEFALYGHDQTIASLASANQFAVVQNSHGAIGAAAASSTLTINQSTDTFYNGYIRDNTGNDGFILALVKAGAGTLTLDGAPYGNGAITYSGGTIINGGAIALNSGGPKGTLPDGGPIIVNAGTLRASATDALGYANHNAGNGIFVNPTGVLTVAAGSRISIDRDLTVNGGTVTSVGAGDGSGASYSLRDANGSVLTFTSSGGGTPATFSAQGIGLNGQATFNVTDGPGGVDLNVTGMLMDNFGTGSLVKEGAGRMVIATTSTYTGATTVNAGTLVFLASQTLSSLTIADGAEVVFGDGLSFVAGPGGKFGGPVLVPEPGTLGLLLLGALGMAARRRRSA